MKDGRKCRPPFQDLVLEVHLKAVHPDVNRSHLEILGSWSVICHGNAIHQQLHMSFAWRIKSSRGVCADYARSRTKYMPLLRPVNDYNRWHLGCTCIFFAFGKKCHCCGKKEDTDYKIRCLDQDHAWQKSHLLGMFKTIFLNLQRCSHHRCKSLIAKSIC